MEKEKQENLRIAVIFAVDFYNRSDIMSVSYEPYSGVTYDTKNVSSEYA